VPRQPRIGRQTPQRHDPQGPKWLRAALIEAANAASRTRNSYLAAQYQRVRARRGHGRAMMALGHTVTLQPTEVAT
jgi:hypothetical protein